ncbi:MAG: molybdopterin-dependent oxidoreductase [Anaerolineae bacterium]|nr:molybdopterin-dependent oxidoreductase [Anaerolineae bacterium]
MSSNELIDDLVTKAVMSRRSFMKWSAAVGGTAAVLASGLEPTLAAMTPTQAERAATLATADEVIWNACVVNCGSRCPLRLTVKDGTIVRVDPDNTGNDEFGKHQVRSCVRGHSIRQRIYNPDRLKYPMKRVGKRGEGKFEKISWDEAFDLVANKLKELIAKYGNESIYLNYGTGTLGALVATSWPPSATPIARLMNCVGGYLNHYGDYSAAQIESALPYTFGSSWVMNNSVEDIANTKLIVYFGNNPGETRMSGGGLIYSLQHYKQVSGAKMIVVDPRYTDTAITAADEWIAIRPGTDAALVSALAYVMIKEEIYDKAFVDKYCVGFDKEHMPAGYEKEDSYKDYILGTGADKTPKTPEWAAALTGIPAARIVKLAREIALTKPCFITQGWGPQRQANGEQNSRAIPMLPILTGNVGIRGGSTGARESGFGIGMTAFPTLENPVKTALSVFNWPDAIVRAKEMTALTDGVQGKDKLDVPIKFIWNYASNTLINQHAQINHISKILQDESLVEMIVTVDVHMTPSAKFADILLPDTTNYEKTDIAQNGDTSSMGYAIFCSQAIKPMFEAKHVYEICQGIAKRLGVEDKFTEGRTVEDWLKYCIDKTRETNKDWPDYDTFKKMGIYKVTNPGDPYIAYEDFRKDPDKNKLPTPSGKIEIFSARLHDIGKTWKLPEGDVITGLPVYVPTWEGVSDPLRSKFPLQMITAHYKQRTHSTYGNVPWMKEAAPQEVWINPVDAQKRGIQHGDLVYVFNERGKTRVAAKVTARIMPGVVQLAEGAWYTPDANGVDQNGCPNILTKYHPSPLAKGDPMHTNLVEIEKA